MPRNKNPAWRKSWKIYWKKRMELLWLYKLEAAANRRLLEHWLFILIFAFAWNMRSISRKRKFINKNNYNYNLNKTSKARKCSSFEKLNKLVKQEIYLSLMLPQVVLYYDNLKETFQVIYRNSFRDLDLRLSRYEKCDFHQVLNKTIKLGFSKRMKLQQAWALLKRVI